MNPDATTKIIESLLRQSAQQINQLMLDVANRDAKIWELSAKIASEGGSHGNSENDGQPHIS